MFCNLYNVLFMLDIHFTHSKCADEQTNFAVGQHAGQTKKAIQPGSASAGVKICLANLAKDQNFL